jgi:RNase P subunit RPR2
MLVIEPLSQSDRGNFLLLLFRLTGTRARVNLFARPDIRWAKGNVMSTKLARPVVPTVEICPNCKSEMTITEVTPILLANGLEDVTYTCKGCRSKIRRTFRRRSGAWQLIRYSPKFPALGRARSAAATSIDLGRSEIGRS